MSLAAHNQEMGNAGTGLSADWPGAFEHAFDATHPGVAIYLVADNGSEEDPESYPPVIKNGSENHSNQATQFIQAQATGQRFASIVSAVAPAAQQLHAGPVTLTRKQICVPLENNGFVALAAAGEFGLRQGYICDQHNKPEQPIPNGSVIPTASSKFRTFVGYTDIGPDLQLIDIPGEAFPALILGSPFGVEDESCNLPNPAVPIWHARAPYRFSVGLADDLLGYLIPAWGFASGTPGLFTPNVCSQDLHGHGHKLESESVGPTGANEIAGELSGLLGAEPDATAHIVQGRYVLADGSLSRWPTGAVGVLLTQSGRLIGAPRTAGFGRRAVDQTGVFMDYDGQPQASPDITTRGIVVIGRGGCPIARYYVDVFPAFAQHGVLGHKVPEPAVIPRRACRGTKLQPLAAAGAGLAVSRAGARLARSRGPVRGGGPQACLPRTATRPAADRHPPPRTRDSRGLRPAPGKDRPRDRATRKIEHAAAVARANPSMAA